MFFSCKLYQQRHGILRLVVYQYLVCIVCCLACHIGYDLVQTFGPEWQSFGFGFCYNCNRCLLLSGMYVEYLLYLVLYARLGGSSIGYYVVDVVHIKKNVVCGRCKFWHLKVHCYMRSVAFFDTTCKLVHNV